jgi:hypothetical protein
MFRRNFLPPTSGLKNYPRKQPTKSKQQVEFFRSYRAKQLSIIKNNISKNINKTVLRIKTQMAVSVTVPGKFLLF